MYIHAKFSLVSRDGLIHSLVRTLRTTILRDRKSLWQAHYDGVQVDMAPQNLPSVLTGVVDGMAGEGKEN